jgi:hypothetical protein
LFKAKYLQTSEEIVKQLIEAYISSSEETMFGDWLEGLAIFINKFTKEFVNLFCDNNGKIDWVKLVKYNSGN